MASLYLFPEAEEESIDFETMGKDNWQAFCLLKYSVLRTRHDLTLVAMQPNQFLRIPGIIDWTTFKCVLRYLKPTWNVGLVLGGSVIAHTWTTPAFCCNKCNSLAIV